MISSLGISMPMADSQKIALYKHRYPVSLHKVRLTPSQTRCLDPSSDPSSLSEL